MGIDYVTTGPVSTFTVRNDGVDPLTGLLWLQLLALGEPDVQDSSLFKR